MTEEEKELYDIDGLKHEIRQGSLLSLSDFLRQCNNIDLLINPLGAAFSTPLEFAARHGKADAVQLLLDYGAAVALRSEHGNGPLIAAIEEGNTAVVRLLIEHGADVHDRDREAGWTSLMNAAWWSGEAGHISFSEKQSDPAVPEYREIVRLLLQAGAVVDETADGGRTALMMVVENSRPDVELVRILVEGGANIEARDARGETALSKALRRNDSGVIEALKAGFQV